MRLMAAIVQPRRGVLPSIAWAARPSTGSAAAMLSAEGSARRMASVSWAESRSMRLSVSGCRMPRKAIAAPTQRGAQTRAERRSMPRSIASTALDNGAGLRRKPGPCLFISSTAGCA